MAIINKLVDYIKPRVTNKGFWVSLFALIPLALTCFGDQSILPENYNDITTIILSLLVAMGIINNPKDGNWYGDTNQDNEKNSGH